MPGTLIISCSHELARYNFPQKTLSTLIADKNIIFDNAGWNQERIYHQRTVEHKAQGTPFPMITPFVPATPYVPSTPFGPSEVFRMKPDGMDIEQLTFDKYDDLNLAVSPKSNLLLYSSDREGDPSAIRYKLVLQNLDNKTEKIILEGDNHFLPVWPPQGDKVAILQTPRDPGEKVNLYLFDVGQNQTVQLIPEEYVLSTTIAWSPDQKYLVISTKRQNSYSIDFLDVSTGKIDQVIGIDYQPGNFTWSPDGRIILFETRNRSNNVDASIKLWWFNIPDNDLKLAYMGGIVGRTSRYHAVWSPDSQAFAFFVSKDNSGMKLIVKSSTLLKVDYPEASCRSSSVSSAVWVGIP